jgi:hypothetical protein
MDFRSKLCELSLIVREVRSNIDKIPYMALLNLSLP